MTATYIGTYSVYVPGPAAPQLYREMSAKGAVFHRNESGEDWYDGIPNRTSGSMIFAIDDDNVVRCVGFGPDGFCPQPGLRTYEYVPDSTPPSLTASGYLEMFGWTFDPVTAEFIEPVVPPPPVPAINRRQFFAQAAKAGDITQAEALEAMITGELPATLEAFITAMPAEAQFDARMLIAGDRFEPDNPLSIGYAALTGRSPEQKDQFFRDAALL